MKQRSIMKMRQLFFNTVRSLTLRDLKNPLYFKSYLAQLEKSDLNLLSHEFLSKIIDQAVFHTEYYHRSSGDDMDLADFGLITKEVINKEFENLRANNISPALTYMNTSGGSSGKPQSFLQEKQFDEWSLASEIFFLKHFHGVDPLVTPKVVLWGSTKDLLKQYPWKVRFNNWCTYTKFLNSYKLTDADWERYVSIINTYKPVYIKGFAGSLYQLAQFLKKMNQKVYKPKFLYSSAETLRPHMRDLIEDVIGAKVVDFYGSREVGPIAGECKAGRKHIFSFHNIVEVFDLNNERPAAIGNKGRVVVTNLHNRAMPLIRYDIGDFGTLSSERCSCGSSLPVLSSLEGRITDHFSLPGGAMLHGEALIQPFDHVPWIESVQINQIEPMVVEILAVLRSKIDEKKKYEIDARLSFLLGKEFKITWRFVDDIPLTPHGKRLYTRNQLHQSERTGVVASSDGGKF